MRIPQKVIRFVAWWQESPRGISVVARVLHFIFAVRRRLPGPKGILLIFTGAVGDMVSLSPVLRELARQHPEIHLGMMVKGAGTGVSVKGCPHIDRIVEFCIYEDTRFKWWEALKAICRITRRRQYETAILTMGTGWVPQYRVWGLLLLYASGAKRRIAFRDECAPWLSASGPISVLPLANEVIDATEPQRTERFLGLFQEAGLLSPPLCANTQVWITEDDLLEVAQLDDCFARTRTGKPVVLIFPGIGSGPGKRWSAGRYIKVIDELVAVYGARVFLDGADRDRPLCRRIAALTRNCTSLAGSHSVGALPALVGRADLVVASDSGPIHIAAATGTPAVAIFGPTDPRIWAPKSSSVIALRITDCPPCNNPFFCDRQPPFSCTADVQTADVLQACRRLLLARLDETEGRNKSAVQCGE